MVFGQGLKFLVMPYSFGLVVLNLPHFWERTTCQTNTYQKILGMSMQLIFHIFLSLLHPTGVRLVVYQSSEEATSGGYISCLLFHPLEKDFLYLLVKGKRGRLEIKGLMLFLIRDLCKS